MLLQFLMPAVLGASIVFVVGTYFSRLFIAVLAPAPKPPEPNAPVAPTPKSYLARHAAKFWDRIDAIIWFNIKVVFIYIEALVIWYGLYWYILSAIQQAVDVQALPDIIAWSVALGFLTCAACVRLWRALNGVVDGLVAHTLPYIERGNQWVRAKVNGFLTRYFPEKPQPRLMRWREIVASYGPLTKSELRAKSLYINVMVPLALCLLVSVGFASAALLGAIVSYDHDGLLRSLLALAAGLTCLLVLTAFSERKRLEIQKRIMADRGQQMSHVPGAQEG